jgi:hypothetical protein
MVIKSFFKKDIFDESRKSLQVSFLSIFCALAVLPALAEEWKFIPGESSVFTHTHQN